MTGKMRSAPMIKKIWIHTNVMLCSLMLVMSAALPAWAEEGRPADDNPPSLLTHAQAAALIDVTSGRIIYDKEGDKELRIASLTKIMTAIVAIEQGNLKDDVTVSSRAFAKEGSSLFLRLGEKMTLEHMLYGLMLRSGNDAATAIAEHVGGSEEGFVFMMNEKAAELGLHHTQFQNPHGLDAEGHYSTANDLARLTAYALHNPTFRKIVGTRDKKAPNPNDPWDYTWLNKNKMLRLYEGADGVKTGYTKKAFRCLVSSATRDGRQLAAVTLNDGDDWNDHANMLDYGFKYYPLQEITRKNTPLQGYNFVTGASFTYPLADGEEKKLVTKLVLNKPAGDSQRAADFGLRGRVELVLDGDLIGQVPVYEQGSFIPDTKSNAAVTSFIGTTRNPTWLDTWRDVIRNIFRS